MAMETGQKGVGSDSSRWLYEASLELTAFGVGHVTAVPAHRSGLYGARTMERLIPFLDGVRAPLVTERAFGAAA